jgi:hypothetical protein
MTRLTHIGSGAPGSGARLSLGELQGSGSKERLVPLRTRLQKLRYVDVAAGRRISSTTACSGFAMMMGNRSRIDLTVSSSVLKWSMARATANTS